MSDMLMYRITVVKKAVDNTESECTITLTATDMKGYVLEVTRLFAADDYWQHLKVIAEPIIERLQ